MKKNTHDTLKNESGLTQTLRMGKSIRQKWVNRYRHLVLNCSSKKIQWYVQVVEYYFRTRLKSAVHLIPSTTLMLEMNLKYGYQSVFFLVCLIRRHNKWILNSISD